METVLSLKQQLAALMPKYVAVKRHAMGQLAHLRREHGVQVQALRELAPQAWEEYQTDSVELQARLRLAVEYEEDYDQAFHINELLRGYDL